MVQQPAPVGRSPASSSRRYDPFDYALRRRAPQQSAAVRLVSPAGECSRYPPPRAGAPPRHTGGEGGGQQRPRAATPPGTRPRAAAVGGPATAMQLQRAAAAEGPAPPRRSDSPRRRQQRAPQLSGQGPPSQPQQQQPHRRPRAFSPQQRSHTAGPHEQNCSAARGRSPAGSSRQPPAPPPAGAPRGCDSRSPAIPTALCRAPEAADRTHVPLSSAAGLSPLPLPEPPAQTHRGNSPRRGAHPPPTGSAAAGWEAVSGGAATELERTQARLSELEERRAALRASSGLSGLPEPVQRLIPPPPPLPPPPAPRADAAGSKESPRRSNHPAPLEPPRPPLEVFSVARGAPYGSPPRGTPVAPGVSAAVFAPLVPPPPPLPVPPAPPVGPLGSPRRSAPALPPAPAQQPPIPPLPPQQEPRPLVPAPGADVSPRRSGARLPPPAPAPTPAPRPSYTQHDYGARRVHPAALGSGPGGASHTPAASPTPGAQQPPRQLPRSHPVQADAAGQPAAAPAASAGDGPREYRDAAAVQRAPSPRLEAPAAAEPHPRDPTPAVEPAEFAAARGSTDAWARLAGRAKGSFSETELTVLYWGTLRDLAVHYGLSTPVEIAAIELEWKRRQP
eukprot:TRINITY_DN5124_c0_g2_i1.p1 TRINITY_DN5124_c0_g2~~TRINITY_DN5124_c0_g2_i1.p1  ORF type:complete len:660 (+),score=92.83 TRINITY_DN5124_c0_g2_i1:127-1980(+)